MTSDEIIRIAKAVGLGEVDEDGDIWCSDGFYTEEIDSFAQLVATAAERKAMEVNSIHSCHSECQRPICVAVRKAVAAEREKLQHELLTLEKWKGMALAKDGDGRTVQEVEREAREAEREKVAQWMMQRGYATGHGDTTEGLLKELDWQIADGWNRALVKGSEVEREQCAKLLDEMAAEDKLSNYYKVAALRIRERGAP